MVLFTVMDYVPKGELFTAWKRLEHFSEALVRICIAELAIAIGKLLLDVSRVSCGTMTPYGYYTLLGHGIQLNWEHTLYPCPYLRKDVDMLEKIQRRATKLIPGLIDLTYEERLNECGLTTLETRRLRGDQIEVFKILNGYENIDSNIFFEIKESKITRGHNYTLVKKQSRLDVRKYSFSQRTINVWNNLSTDCVQASSVNMFKNKIDKYLVKAGYT